MNSIGDSTGGGSAGGNPQSRQELEGRLAEFRAAFARVREEVAKKVVGQDEVVRSALIALFAGGHCLLEGVPGLGKTLLVRTLGEVLDLKYSRIQFTPDLMPADIIGTRIVMESDDGSRRFEFQRGPIFGQIILADEVNRATPKTQSALLEAMQEHTVTVGRERHQLEEPFLVMATQNPLEMDGTYPLPEAQLDRFIFKVDVPFPTREELSEVMGRTTDIYEAQPEKVLDGPTILANQRLIRELIVAPHVRDYAIRLVLATHPGDTSASESVNRFVHYGASPRGAQALMLGGKVRAALDSRYNVSFDDVRATAHAALRHRLILNFEGEAEGKKADTILDEILERVPEVLPDSLAS
ncbi:MAG: MoxR family ATPase [Planctomycetes bacterium]|nr:MoxR family ATPase [Planctomycetota bacterium]